jgi:hypothetical protein
MGASRADRLFALKRKYLNTEAYCLWQLQVCRNESILADVFKKLSACLILKFGGLRSGRHLLKAF